MTKTEFLSKLKSNPEQIDFKSTMAVIEANYSFTETAFKNGDTYNEAGTNNGSCKIFAFGKVNSLTKEETLACFGSYYREDVLGHPKRTDHANIRNFMSFGWQGITFNAEALQEK